ncbi:hypothetical protein G6F52_014225 [Rhizopus delemar]|uniref:Uncharacterized protein n=1 Tax=Rhizopus delemar TaxID=936053 RepID=A0A9P7BYK8_9FUNG|nr:hypothetical protein G6F52_014225 [Rhizopus delemar]KAG1523485.1 hypothetical protein G6F50_018606 [Rhizopus delemar]
MEFGRNALAGLRQQIGQVAVDETRPRRAPTCQKRVPLLVQPHVALLPRTGIHVWPTAEKRIAPRRRKHAP